MKSMNLLAVLAFLAFAVSCKQAPKADEGVVENAQPTPEASVESTSLELDPQQSMVTWIGTKPTGQHNGVIRFKSSEVKVKGNELESASIVMDMNTLQALDMDEEGNTKLSTHLKSGDFFDVEKHPEAKFEFVNMKPYVESEGEKPLLADVTHIMTGNLTIKDSTKAVTFPVFFNLDDKGLDAKASFNIDRSDWGLSYGNDKSLGDRFIRPEVNVGFNLVGKR